MQNPLTMSSYQLPDICIIHILSFLPLPILLSTRRVCRRWRDEYVPHALLGLLKQTQSQCTVIANPPYINFSWAYDMTHADRLCLKPVAVKESYVLFLPEDNQHWIATATDGPDFTARSVRHFKVDFSGWPSGAEARKFTRRQFNLLRRRQRIGWTRPTERVSSQIEEESVASSSSPSSSSSVSSVGAGASWSHTHRGTVESVGSSVHASESALDASHLNEPVVEDVDEIMVLTDPATEDYENVMAATAMDAEEQGTSSTNEPVTGTNGPVVYTTPDTSLVPGDTTIIHTDTASVASHGSFDDTQSDTSSLSEDALSDETTTTTTDETTPASLPGRLHAAWAANLTVDEWVRAWHRLHVTFRPTSEIFYAADTIEGYVPSLKGIDVSELNEITGGYAGDHGITVRFEHHKTRGFRVIWIRASFAWLLSGWFVSAPDIHGPTAHSVMPLHAEYVATTVCIRSIQPRHDHTCSRSFAG
jgi:hypothetical protein